jgi:sec-independent protein translocase protein TatA
MCGSEYVLAGVFGWQQILIIAIVILLLFGGKKIPELMKGLGKGMKEFKNAAKDGEDESSSTDIKKD